MKYFFYNLFFMLMLINFSCSNNSQNNTGTSTTAQKKRLDTADIRLANDLSGFFTSQVQAAQLVQARGSGKKVKELAKQNEQLYTQMGNYLNNLSEEYQVKLPAQLSPTTDKNLAELKAIKTARIDHAYLLQMLKDHNITIRETNAAKNVECVPLKTFVVSNQSAIIKQAYALSALKDITP